MGKHNLINETRIEYNGINGVKNKPKVHVVTEQIKIIQDGAANPFSCAGKYESSPYIIYTENSRMEEDKMNNNISNSESGME